MSEWGRETDYEVSDSKNQPDKTPKQLGPWLPEPIRQEK